MDQIAARIHFYHARFHELTNKLADIRPYVSYLFDEEILFD